MDPLMRQIRMLKLKLYEASDEVKKQKSFANVVEGTLKDLKEQLRLSQEQSAARLKEREIELEKIIVKALMDKHEGEERNNLLNEEIAALKTALAKMTDSQKITEAKYRSLLDEIEKAAKSISCNEIEDVNNGNNPQHLINALEFETQAYAGGPSTSTSASVAQSEPLAIRDGAKSSGSDDGGVLAEFLGMNGGEPNVVPMSSRNLRMRTSTADKQEKACSGCPQAAKVDRGMKRKAPDGEEERMKHGEDNQI
ncbi:Lon protease 1, mitochondrial [Orchesella cincta]|uniref:Lon protease 1, mitochondrial n=1 Tax=Orchesella cincta TaxID=48709 RepID=A0A1D2MXV3_ORCCI|nr:Lon protease 1, mitochondrial [Orchesella cincta]